MLRVLAMITLSFLFTACSEQPSEQTTAPAATDAAEANAGDRAGQIQQATATIDGARISKGEPGNWLSTGRTYDEQRHSPLDQVNRETVKDLGLEWYWDTGTKRGLEGQDLLRHHRRPPHRPGCRHRRIGLAGQHHTPGPPLHHYRGTTYRQRQGYHR